MMRSRTVSMWAGWLASTNDSNIVVGGAGVHLHRTLPHPLSRSALSPKVASVSSLMYLPNRNGEDEVSPGCCFDESSNGREQNAWIALSFTLRKKAERSTNDSDSSQAMRCDWRAISLFLSRRASACGQSVADQPRTVFIPCRMIRSINCGYGKPALPAESAKSSSSARMGFGFASMK